MSLRAHGAGESTAAYPLSWQGSGALAASAELPPVRPALSPALSVLLCVWAAVVLADAVCLEARTGALWLGCDPRLAVWAGAGFAVVEVAFVRTDLSCELFPALVSQLAVIP